MSPFLRVGVTGCIGSGKSTVCRLFSGIGRNVIVADEIARNIADADVGVKKAILREFGSSAYLATGSLDRKKIASIVFDDEKRRAKLDSIIHPRVFEEINHQINSLPSDQAFPYILVEAALIFETGMDESLDYVIVVTAEEETCIQRVIARDNVSREEVRKRITAQMPIADKVKRADFAIQNNGPESGLRDNILFLDHLLSHLIMARES